MNSDQEGVHACRLLALADAIQNRIDNGSTIGEELDDVYAAYARAYGKTEVDAVLDDLAKKNVLRFAAWGPTVRVVAMAAR